MKYDPEVGDVLPDGYTSATDAEQEEYWRSRAETFLERAERRVMAAEIRETRRENFEQGIRKFVRSKVAPHDHVPVERISFETETDDRLALDGGIAKVCSECNCLLELVA